MNNRNKRLYETRTLNRLYLISTEGAKTEKCYFDYLEKLVNTTRQEQGKKSDIVITILPTTNGESAPSHVLRRMKKHLSGKRGKLNKDDEAWLVVDMDRWTETHKNDCYNWSEGQNNFGFALSNPKFEYWLLLHFEKPKGVTSQSVINKLKYHIPGYKKAIKECTLTAFTLGKIADAIERAKIIDNPPCEKWPEKTGTTVYRLVNNIVKNVPEN